MPIAPATHADKDDWHGLRCALWRAERLTLDQLDAMLAAPDRFASFIARDEDGTAVGFAEATLRYDYVNGCETSPVLFLEGLYVLPSYRRTGVARQLVDAVADWGRTLGCTEFASDALLDNIDSHRMHRALGFEETERVIYFRRLL